MLRYRTEACSGSGVRNILDVIKFEIFELGNMDILITLSDTYLSEDKNKLSSLIVKLDAGDITNINQDAMVTQLVDKFKKATHQNLQYALWLADYDVVVSDYDGVSGTIDGYEISDFILSELGHDGTLYAYTTLPLPTAN